MATRAEEDKLIMVDDKPVPKQEVPKVNAPVITQKPAVITPAGALKDTVKKVPPPLTNGTFVINTSAPHNVLMLLDKVDGVYINEAKNAFTRYNKENYYGQVFTITKDAVDGEHSILIISSFTDGATALQYYDKIKKAAPREVSWLQAAKYSFVIITNENLEVLKINKDITGYKALLNKQYPGKF